MKLIRASLFLCGMYVIFVQAEWQNWGKNQFCSPKHVVSPKSKEELISNIMQAAKHNYKMSISGMGYSFSDIVNTNEYMIQTKHLDKILSIDNTNRLVRAQGGITLNEFNRQIACHGLSLANFPAMGEMTLAGAVATATHGTGKTGTLASFVTEIELIDAEGKTHHFSRKLNPEVFKAACVSLGALGVMYALTMQCEPLFMLEYSTQEMSLNEMLFRYRELHHESDYFQFRWQLSNDRVYADFWNKQVFYDVSANQKFSYEALQWASQPEVGMTAEIAVPFESLPGAVRLIKHIVNEWIKRGLIIEEVVVRFAKTDGNSYLSPAADRDVVYLDIGVDSEERYYEFFKEFEEAMIGLNGRPHWGKVNFLNYEKAYRLYGENLTKFIEVKKKIDPMNVFSNPFLNKVLLKNPDKNMAATNQAIKY